jgi:hypothetical protein
MKRYDGLNNLGFTNRDGYWVNCSCRYLLGEIDDSLHGRLFGEVESY